MEKTQHLITMQWLNDGVATEETMVVNCHIQGTIMIKVRNIY